MRCLAGEGLFSHLAIIASLFMFSCSGEGKKNADAMDFEGDQSATGVVVTQSDAGRKLWTLAADSMEQLGDTVRVQGVSVTFFDKRGKQESVLVSDSGRYYQASGDMTAFGDVEVRSEDGSLLRTATLSFSKEREQIFTPDRVYIRSEDKEVWGVGLVSDPGLTRVEVLEQVTGTGSDETWGR